MYRDLQQLSDRVWYYPRDTDEGVVQPNVGVIQSGNQTILVDGGNSPRHSRRIISELAACGFAPVDVVIYTHHHWDHVFGAMVFNAERIIAHHRCDTALRKWSHRDWSHTALREEALHHPELQVRNQGMRNAIDDWRDFHICLPTMTFSQSLTLYVDDETTLELTHVGGVHASDSITVKVVEAGVLFLGDSYYPPPFHLRTPENAETLDLTMLDQFMADDEIDMFLDGHGDPRDRQQMTAMIAAERQRQEQAE